MGFPGVPETSKTQIFASTFMFRKLIQVSLYVMRCAIWNHLYNLKNVKNTHGGVLISVTKINTLPWVFFTFFQIYKWYQIAQRTTYSDGAGAYIRGAYIRDVNRVTYLGDVYSG